jgi:hypothetical protein
LRIRGFVERGPDRRGSVRLEPICVFVTLKDNWVGRRQVDHHVVIFPASGCAELEGLNSMRLEVVSLPDPMDRAVRDPDFSSQLAGAPVAQTTSGWLQSSSNDLGTLALANRRRSPGTRLVGKSVESFLGESSSESTDLHGGVPGLSSHLGTRDVVSQQQDHTSSATQTGRDARRSLKSLQFGALGFPESDGTGMVGHDPSRNGLYLEGILT